MKKQESLTIKKQPAPRAAGVSALPAGVLLLTGLWGAAWRWLSPAQSAWRLLWPLLAAWAALTLCLLFRPERRRNRIAALAALLAFLAGALLLRGRLAEAGNHVTIVPLGACTEHLYLPYGAASDLPDAADLAGEGSRAAMPQRYAAALYPVEDSYLLQKALSQETGSDYLTGEAAYRQWVYAHDLTVPQSTYEALTQRFSPAQSWTTTQAKTEILRFLAENLTYR